MYLCWMFFLLHDSAEAAASSVENSVYASPLALPCMSTIKCTPRIDSAGSSACKKKLLAVLLCATERQPPHLHYVRRGADWPVRGVRAAFVVPRQAPRHRFLLLCKVAPTQFNVPPPN
mmetsp:Transcript_8986/g.17191  ORF Transcript_8986/g.17191 Transcript_8986/m.17191 type:complete len:118 (-) Transcript_8986:589-942(-)